MTIKKESKDVVQTRALTFEEIIRVSTSTRRGEFRIMLELLSAMRQPRRITNLMYMTKLNYIQLRKHLSSLIEMGLAEEIRGNGTRRLLRLTEKGIKFNDAIGTNDDSSYLDLNRSKDFCFLDRRRGLP